MIDYAMILTVRFADRQWKLDGNEYESLTMLDDGPKPSKKQLEDAWPSVKAEIAAEIDKYAKAKISGRAKLAALGLTDTEITALLGA